MMKLTQIAMAVALATSVASAFAAPVLIADITAAKTANTLDQTWLSGASAQAQVVYFGFRDTCDAGTVSIFTNDSVANNNTVPGTLGNFVAYACKSGGRTKVVYHTMDGGSFNAFAPHTNGVQLDRLKYLPTAACVQNATTYPATGTNTAAVFNGCTRAGAATVAADTTAPKLPAGGFSDVEAKLFGSQFANDPATLGTETAVGLTQGFGVVVNTTLYRTLQVAQGINGYTTVAAATAGDPSFSPANAPNITSAQYASIAAGTYATDWSPILGTAGVNKPIYLARRIDSSGTQAASNAFFLKNPCSGDPVIVGAVAPTVATLGSNVGVSGTSGTFSGSATTGAIVFAGSGTTDVKVAITSAETNGKFAIGVVSLENTYTAETNAARKEYRFVKLDGIHPELADTTYARSQMVSGAYQFQYESTSYVANTADAFGAALIPAIVAQISASTNCSTDPISRGLALTAGSTVPAACQATMVAKGTRLGNSCSPIQLF